ncbi:hypothetical protein [Larkinella sp.]|uniref:hypothetical protein n=1 Tax=Larkinella sp. TaxID=2034517 RepID=UPI003BABA58D
MRTRLFSLVIFTSLAIALLHCKKSEPDPATPGGTTPPGSNTSVTGAATIPVVKTAPTITGIASTSAQVSAVLGSNGGEAITQHGYTYAETGKESKQVSLGATSGPFPLTVTAKLTNLLPNTAYTVYFFAVNKVGQISMKVEFKTEAVQASAAKTVFTPLGELPFTSTFAIKFLTVGNRLFAADNAIGNGYKVYEYELTANRWVERAAFPFIEGSSYLPYSRIGVIDGKIYTVTELTSTGGFGQYICVYDPATNVWTKTFSSRIQPLGTVSTLAGPGTFAVDGKLYTFGGDQVNAITELDVKLNKITRQVEFPLKNVSGDFKYYTKGGFVANDKIYVAVGLVASTSTYGLYEFDPKTAKWTEKAKNQGTLSDYEQFAVLNNKAYALLTPHRTSTNRSDGQMPVYDLDRNEWSTTPIKLFISDIGGDNLSTYSDINVGVAGGRAFVGGGKLSRNGTSTAVKKFFEFKP